MSRFTSTAIRLMSVAAFALGAGLLAPDLAAQEQQMQPQQQAPDIEISDAEMEQFVTAYLEVEQIQMELNEDLQSAQATEEAQQLQRQANQEMAAAIAENGMETERFSLIVQAINADPELQEDFAAKRMEMSGEEPAAQP